MPAKNTFNSFIGKGSFFEGKFYVSDSIFINGKFEGEMKTDGSVIVGQEGKAKTNIDAKEVAVEGAFIGDIRAKKEVRLENTGKILGDIMAPTVHVSPGVVAKGSIHITGSAKKSASSLIEEAYSNGGQTFTSANVKTKKRKVPKFPIIN